MDGFIFPNVPEEVKQKLEEQRQRQHMEHADWQNALKAFFTELPSEHLVTFRKIMMIATDDDNVCAYFQGVTTGVLQYARNVCPEHGTTDCEELVPPVVEVEPEPEPEKESEDVDYVLQEQQLREYHVRPITSSDTTFNSFYPNGVICTRCEYYAWVSLEDRMRRGPDECPQCIHAAKFGGPGA